MAAEEEVAAVVEAAAALASAVEVVAEAAVVAAAAHRAALRSRVRKAAAVVVAAEVDSVGATQVLQAATNPRLAVATVAVSAPAAEQDRAAVPAVVLELVLARDRHKLLALTAMLRAAAVLALEAAVAAGQETARNRTGTLVAAVPVVVEVAAAVAAALVPRRRDPHVRSDVNKGKLGSTKLVD